MDRFQRVEKPKAEATPINENEIRITAQGRMRNYITYATTLLQEKESDEIVLKAMGRAINKTVMIAELIKRRILGLHQNTSIGSTDITDVYEPLEEGLLPVESTRHVSTITITLSKKELLTSSTGYQSPLPVDQVKQLNDFEDDGDGSPGFRGRGPGGRGRGRGRGNYNGVGDYNGDGWDGGRGYGGRGRGRSRGGSFRGRGRGYGQSGGYYDYVEGAPAQGRGRGQGRGRAVGAVVILDWMDKHLLLEPMFDYKICVDLKKLTYGMPALLAYVLAKFADSYAHRLSFLSLLSVATVVMLDVLFCRS